jgi:tetratricopeptide (TPR) repeat protein
VLVSGARWPERLGPDPAGMEIHASLEALRDPETTPILHLAGISFAYLLYHWKRLEEAFATLESLDRFLCPDGDRCWCYPCEDPFYVGGLFLSHGKWHDAFDLPGALAWFRRSAARGTELEYRGVVLGAIALTLHRLERHGEARTAYEEAIELLHGHLDEELSAEPIFGEELELQIDIFRAQLGRLAARKPPDAVLTKDGWAAFATGTYSHWTPDPAAGSRSGSQSS